VSKDAGFVIDQPGAVAERAPHGLIQPGLVLEPQDGEYHVPPYRLPLSSTSRTFAASDTEWL